MNNVLQGELSEDPVIIWGVQAYKREDAPKTGMTSLLYVGKTRAYNREGWSSGLI